MACLVMQAGLATLDREGAGPAHTPMAALAENTIPEAGADATRSLGRDPQASLLADVQASAKKRLSSAGRRRSLSRTPGTKIVIIERGTQTTPGTAAKRPATQVRVCVWRCWRCLL